MNINEKLAFMSIGILFIGLVVRYIAGNYRRWMKYVWSQYVVFAVWFSSIILRHNGYIFTENTLIHAKTFDSLQNEIDVLYKRITTQQNEIELLHTGIIKKERGTNQMSFGDIADRRNGQKQRLTFPWLNPETGKLDIFELEFNKWMDYAQFKDSNNYMWVMRDHPPVGKRDGHIEYTWVRVPRDENDKGPNFYNPKTDYDLMLDFPYFDRKDKLPFKIIDTGESVKQMRLPE